MICRMFVDNILKYERFDTTYREFYRRSMRALSVTDVSKQTKKV